MGLFRIAAATGLLLVVAPDETRGVLSQMFGAADEWRRAAPEASVKMAAGLLPDSGTAIEAASLAARVAGVPADTVKSVSRICEERPDDCEKLAREIGRKLAQRH